MKNPFPTEKVDRRMVVFRIQIECHHVNEILFHNQSEM